MFASVRIASVTVMHVVASVRFHVKQVRTYGIQRVHLKQDAGVFGPRLWNCQRTSVPSGGRNRPVTKLNVLEFAPTICRQMCILKLDRGDVSKQFEAGRLT